MSIGYINDDQLVFRCIHHPKAFQGNKKLRPVRSLYLKPQGDHFISSVVWQRFAPSRSLVHAYGCRKSRQRKNIGEKDTYCGFYAVEVGEIRNIKKDIGLERFDVKHNIEHGEISHADLLAYFDSRLDIDDIEQAKTYAVDRIWRLLLGPEVHICPEDQSLTDHPSSLLPQGSNGAYLDRRTITEIAAQWVWFGYGTVRWARLVNQQMGSR